MRRTGLFRLLLVLVSLSAQCRKKPGTASRQSPPVRAVLPQAATGDLVRVRSMLPRGVDVNVEDICNNSVLTAFC